MKRSLLTAIVLSALAVLMPPGLYAASSSSSFCWRSLAPDNGTQNINLAVTEPELASNGSGEAWLSWEENSPKVIRWSGGRWTQLPEPSRPGVPKMRYPVVSADTSGKVFLAVSANGEHGIAQLHVARWAGDSWEWIGNPLISSKEPFTHANDASIVSADGLPIIAWAEERRVTLAGLFVSRWNGSSWQRLGVLSPQGSNYYLSPTLAVDANGRIWLSWKEEGPQALRVARWDGTAWLDIGRKSLEKLVAASGSAFQQSLAVDSKGQAWLLWLAADNPDDNSLALARWNGTDWARVRAPRALEGQSDTVCSARMVLRNDVPVIAWSQSDDTENHRLYAAEWGAGDTWILRISGLHLAEGFSDVRDVRVAVADSRSLFFSWDETGKDNRRTRLVQAYPCEIGEVPAAPPKSIIERDTWPVTVDEAARMITATLDEESKERVRSTKKEDLILYHMGWSTGIRNNLGLWKGNEKLLESCGHGKIVHPDECSMIIIEAAWKLLQAP